MEIEKAKQLSYDNIRKIYKAYLQSQELGKNTVQTIAGDTFYLWNKEREDHKQEQKELTEAIANNTLVIQKLIDKLGGTDDKR